MQILKFSRLRANRGSTALIVGLAAPAVIAFVGLTVDLSGVLAAKAKIELSADSSSLSAIMTAASALRTDPVNYQATGQAAGLASFNAQAGSISTVSTPMARITMARSGTTMLATTTWSASYNTFFGKLFGVTSWPITGKSIISTQLSTPYLNVEVLLDNSPSMEIGATANDINILQQMTPCGTGTGMATGAGTYTYAPGAIYGANRDGSGGNQPLSGQSYSAYQCASGGGVYDGSLSCPMPAMSPPYRFSTFNPSSNLGGPSCGGFPNVANQTSGPTKGQPPLAGAPCAFACHFDTSKPAGAGNDYYGIARSTIGTSSQVTLRFDVVKSAVNTLISTMQSNDNATFKYLNVGVFTFDHNLTQIYPTNGTEASDDWGAATAAVGGPPTVANGPDTGIQPYGGDNGGDTDFPDTMSALSSQLTASGDGMTNTQPRKVLFLVTDGVQDYTNSNGVRSQSAIDPSYCQPFKDNGYVVYVVYTPYYPLMNGYYLSNMTGIVEGSGAGTTTANLKACASDPVADYIQASDHASLVAALQTFFQLAMTTPPARYTH